MCVFSLWSNPLQNALPQSDLLLCCGMAFGRRVCAAVLTISSHSNHMNAPQCMAHKNLSTQSLAKNDILVYFLLCQICVALCSGLFFISVVPKNSHQKIK
jgi:hypothetical protein